ALLLELQAGGIGGEQVAPAFGQQRAQFASPPREKTRQGRLGEARPQAAQQWREQFFEGHRSEGLPVLPAQDGIGESGNSGPAQPDRSFELGPRTIRQGGAGGNTIRTA